MKMFSKLALLAALVGSQVALPAAAGDAELFNARRAGPIKNGTTTLSKVEKWFGEADSVKKVTRGCIKVFRAKWGKRLKVYAVKHPKGGRRVAETWAKRRTLTSSEHGDLIMHTRKGLRVRDKVKKLKRLYPKYQRFRFKGRSFYELRPTEEAKPRLMAIGKNKKVTALINRPYEYC